MFLRKLLTISISASVLPWLWAQQAGEGARPAGEVFKNVKVLKAISRTEFLDSMRYMSLALGESCDACHVMKDGHMAAELDDKKEKQTARKMIEMTLAINRDHFEGHAEVGCATCHHGREHPDRFPPMEFGAPRPVRPEKPPEGVSATQLIAAYVNRLGGDAVLRKFTTRVDKGTLTRENGQSAKIEALRKAPDAYALTIDGPNGAMREAFRGGEGWMAGGPMVRQADGIELDRLRRDAEFFPALDAGRRLPAAKVTGIETIGGSKAWVVAGRGENSFERLYFDIETGLLLRRIVVHRTAVGDMPEQTDFSDYRKVDGVEVPFSITRQEVNARWNERYTEVTFGAPVDDGNFRKPAPRMP